MSIPSPTSPAPQRFGALSFARHGAIGGRAMVLHHGLVGSVGLDPAWAAAAQAAGLEVLTVARPGYGDSAPVSMGSVAEWGAMLAPLLDHLQLQRVDSVGISAGAPYALALAATLPERVRRVGLLSGVPRVCDDDVLALYSEEMRAAYARYRSGTPEEVAAELSLLLQAGQARLEPDHPWQASLRASLLHGGHGPGREARLQIRPWGFEPSAVTAEVVAWHAEQDDQVPFLAVQRGLRALPSATLRVQPEPQHVPSETTLRELIAWLNASAP